MATVNYDLYTNSDEKTKFKEWREKVAGDTDSNMVRIDNALAGKQDELSGEAGQFYYVLGSREEKVDTVVRKLNGLLNGKGSGKGLMAQGMFSSAEDEIRRVWEERLWKE